MGSLFVLVLVDLAVSSADWKVLVLRDLAKRTGTGVGVLVWLPMAS
jgi:hypothetical protein